MLYFLFDVYTFKSGGPDLTYPPKRLEQSASRRFGGGVSTSFYSPTTTPAPPNIRAKPLRPCILTKAHIITSRGRESRLNLYSDVVIPPPPLYLIPHFSFHRPPCSGVSNVITWTGFTTHSVPKAASVLTMKRQTRKQRQKPITSAVLQSTFS